MAPFDDIPEDARVEGNFMFVGDFERSGSLTATAERPSMLVFVLYNPEPLGFLSYTVISEQEVAHALKETQCALSPTLPGQEQMTVRAMRLDHEQMGLLSQYYGPRAGGMH